MGEFWVRIRIPLRAVAAAIDALKARAMLQHRIAGTERNPESARDLRASADQTDQHAEDFKAGLREWEDEHK